MVVRYRGPDPEQVETVIEELERLRRLMGAWAEGPPTLLQVSGGHVTPGEVVEILGVAAAPWERARAAWTALRHFEAELPVKSREVMSLLGALRAAIACALGPEEARRLLSRPKRARR